MKASNILAGFKGFAVDALHAAFTDQTTIPTFTQYGQLLVQTDTERDQVDARFKALAYVAPYTFGEKCFTPKVKGQDNHPDAQALRDSLSNGFAKAYALQQGLPVDDPIVKKHASTKTSVYFGRMANYFTEMAAGKVEKDTVALSQFAVSCIKKLIGHGEKLPPQVHGDAKQIAKLVAELKRIAGDAYKAPKVVTGKKAKTKAKRASKVEVVKSASAANDGVQLQSIINGIVKAA